MHAQLTTPEQAAQWLQERVAGTVVIDSRQVQPGDGFIAWSGHVTDARAHVGEALRAGAAACLVEHAGLDAYEQEDWMQSLSLPVASYRGLKQDLGLIADASFAHPSRSLEVVAVTGTNGKSSTAWWVAQALTHLRRPCGLIGTFGTGQPGSMTGTGLTTPDPMTLHRSLRAFVDAGMQACALEASSIGLSEHRLDGTQLAVAVFTNLSQEHLDYHGSMAAYGQAKARLFAWPGLHAAVIHLDASGFGQQLLDDLRVSSRPAQVLTVAVEQPADLSARQLKPYDAGTAFTLVVGEQQRAVRWPVVGGFNVANGLCVLGALRALRVPLDDALDACARLGPVPGRLQPVRRADNDPLVFVDYAHTPDALEQVLQAIRPWAQAQGGQLWCLFGCGGDRDPGKRALMGEVAGRLADRVVLTSDNPRSEDPAAIIEQIAQGLSRRPDLRQPDRARAIADCLRMAKPQDVVLIAGKGHETTQEIGGVRRPFSDVAMAEQALQRRGGVSAGVDAGGEGGGDGGDA